MTLKRKTPWYWIKLGVWAVLAALVLGLAVSVVISLLPQKAKEISVEKAQKVLNEKLDKVLQDDRAALVVLRENTTVQVQSLEYGDDKDILLHCTYQTVDLYGAMSENINSFITFDTTKPNGMQMSGTEIRLKIEDLVTERIPDAEPISGEVDILVYEVDGKPEVYLNDEIVNTCYGGIIDISKFIADLKTLTVNGKEVPVERYANIRNGLAGCVQLSVESRAKPDNSHPLVRWWNGFVDEYQRNFGGNGWRLIMQGLLLTLGITFFALLIGLVLGILVAIIRCTHDKLGNLKFLDSICRLYLTVTRGTPVMVQLLIVFFVVLAPLGFNEFTAAVICFGLNSGAYVAEIVRGGIMAVDDGQMEAGRSLGFNYVQTMWHIVVPQAFKAILPALANEFITLLKETSVASCIGVADLTFRGNQIRGRTYSAFMPLLAVAVIYLAMVLILSYLVKLLERRLRKSDRG